MNRFAELLDRLCREPSPAGKSRLLSHHFSVTPDPDRGWALAALTGSLRFASVKPSVLHRLLAERVDPVLLRLSYDYVGDLSETAALLWQAPRQIASGQDLSLGQAYEQLRDAHNPDLPVWLANCLDKLDETGRWALLKLMSGGVQTGVTTRLVKTALMDLSTLAPDDIDEVWHGLEPPYVDLFAWIEGRAPRPDPRDSAPFRALMRAHAITPNDFEALNPNDFLAEWKWDGMRVLAAAGGSASTRVARLYSRSGEDISAAFPDLVAVMSRSSFGDVAIDGELLIVVDGCVQPYAALQQRLARKSAPAKLQAALPAHIRAYDLLTLDAVDRRILPFRERRALLEKFVTDLDHPRVDLSPLAPFSDWRDLAAARANPSESSAGVASRAVEGLMLKRADSPYVPGRPKGLWWKWKRDPVEVEAVLMYAQRGHGKNSSFYSNITFGVWKMGPVGDELTSVGQTSLDDTNEELAQLDLWVREHTRNRFGPVREVEFESDVGLVLQIAFEGVSRAARRKSGLVMRLPRIVRIRWDKAPREADRLESLEVLLNA